MTFFGSDILEDWTSSDQLQIKFQVRVECCWVMYICVYIIILVHNFLVTLFRADSSKGHDRELFVGDISKFECFQVRHLWLRLYNFQIYEHSLPVDRVWCFFKCTFVFTVDAMHDVSCSCTHLWYKKFIKFLRSNFEPN